MYNKTNILTHISDKFRNEITEFAQCGKFKELPNLKKAFMAMTE